MNQPVSSKPRIVIFATKTGGGHWSPALAIAEEITRQTNDGYQIEVIDALYSRPNSRLTVDYAYSLMIRRYQPLWRVFFYTMNNQVALQAGDRMLYGMNHKNLSATLKSGPCPQVVISTNSIIHRPITRLLRKEYPEMPFVSVVTDPVKIHKAWVHKPARLVLVPSAMAREALIRMGQPAEVILETGLPVSNKFLPASPAEKRTLREELHLDLAKPTVLIMHGAEGHMNVHRNAKAIDRAFGPRVQQIVVCGKNEALKDKMDTSGFGPHVKIYGFSTQISTFMRAADLLITKAGALTVSEALACGLPILISQFLPGQEEGIPEWLEEHQAGMPAFTPPAVVDGMTRLVNTPALLQTYAVNARALGRPDAAAHAAEAILKLV
ncbi:MAG TPA: glycosyltransferase [Anaerolineales bacterium]|nr:glycosyltransferase [Anaerolineales bacterium]